jgi:polygalacturonase
MRIMRRFLLLSAMLLLSVTAGAKSAVKYLTVGGAKADIHGYKSSDIQSAVDSVHRMGGGIVRLLPGVYEVTGPVRVYSNMSLVGAGVLTVLHKSDGFSTAMIADAEKGSDRITVKDATGFTSGTGIKIFDSQN